ncbi:hypothetical protein L7F22_037094 [Adiantum nelumboides]|nr:hypothetical protein [Adiantum nelumboides]
MRHSHRRVEQAMRNREFQASSPSNNTANARTGFAHNDFSDEDQDYTERSPVNRILPYVDAIKLNWKWSSDSEVADHGSGEVSQRPVVVKERSVFIGCIPDGIEDIGEILQGLMETFLERFDFAPFELSQVQMVRLVKDFAFLELATDKVAQIVLAANQLDVFEWGFNGCHFNIEGCNGTLTSVKPLYEYIALKPARVIFVGNIPQTCWQTDYLEETQNGGLSTKILFVGISARDEYFKIDCVRKVFDEVLPLISRKTNRHAYLEYISIQPGKDYAFFQFNSEIVADAIMDEYVESTQLFVCKNSHVTYIILRLPEYVRPGARYRQAVNQRRLSGQPDSRFDRQQKGPFYDRRQFPGGPRPRNTGGDQSGTLVQVPRKYGDEPAKKADCVMSIGASLPPIAIWNGPGATSADPDSLIVVEGIPKGFNYKLLRGALNELFERTLAQTGLLDVGMLILGYLDRDEDFDLVGCLPSAEFVHALLSVRKVFVVCGHEIRLLAKEGKRTSNGRQKINSAPWGQEEFGSDDEEAVFDRGSFRNGDESDWNGNEIPRDRKRGYPESANAYEMTVRGTNLKRRFANAGTNEWYHSQGLRSTSPMPKEEFRNQERDRDWNSYNSARAMDGTQWQDGNPQGNAPYAGFSAVENRGFIRNQNAGRNFRRGGFRRFN